MAPKADTKAKQAAQSTQPTQPTQPIPQPEELPVEEIEAIDDVDGDEEDVDLDEEDLGSFDDGLFDPMQQLTQLLVTESGIPLVDVVQGIQDALDKQNKILYKLVSVIESK